jgi:hypothetical protein
MPRKTKKANRLVVSGKHIAAQNDIRNNAGSVAIHGAFRRLEEADFYPEHDIRKESPAYAEVHRKLVEDEDRSCLVCGVKNSILKKIKRTERRTTAVPRKWKPITISSSGPWLMLSTPSSSTRQFARIWLRGTQTSQCIKET